MAAKDFALPERGAYRIGSRALAVNSLAMVQRFGTESEKQRVRNAVHKRYPSLNPDRRSPNP